ncbi:hypothetical protein EL22_19845 [Halostagnicola sp. A56]|nr:hypothetical protein EL22_19845 [Halostagnicola sp. A56]
MQIKLSLHRIFQIKELAQTNTTAIPGIFSRPVMCVLFSLMRLIYFVKTMCLCNSLEQRKLGRLIAILESSLSVTKLSSEIGSVSVLIQAFKMKTSFSSHMMLTNYALFSRTAVTPSNRTFSKMVSFRKLQHSQLENMGMHEKQSISYRRLVNWLSARTTLT